MSNVSLFGKKWIDLVFENKNKVYGAYKLRQENPRTTLTALFFGLLFFASIGGAGLLLSSFTDKPVIEPAPILPDVTLVHMSKLRTEPEKATPRKEIATRATKPAVTDRSTLVVVKSEENPSEVKPNDFHLTEANPSNEGLSDVANAAATNANASNASSSAMVPSSGIYRSGSLDKLPEFPGGIKKFNKYISSNFEQPTIGTVKTLRVLMSFVIEIDGGISDIKVLENPGNGLDKEAMRVLKSLKTKWQPGIKDGKPVRTLFTLPISIVTE